jgi:hypothetical protein
MGNSVNKSNWNTLRNILVVVLMCATAMLGANYCQQQKHDNTREVVTLCDTVYLYDTIVILQPIAESSQLLGKIISRQPIAEELIDSVCVHIDSVAVELPIEQVHYKGEDYEAWVSGVGTAERSPQLDSLWIFSQREVITNTNVVNSKTKHWGVSVGVGLVGSRQGVAPGAFVGVTYTISLF